VILEFLKRFVLTYFLALLAAGVLETAGKAVTGSRTILLKLAMTGVPLLALSIALFGVFTYRSYYDSLRVTYTTQTEDQGNLLRALFGSESFDSITSPDRYGGAEYSYIKATMDTRDVYTSSAYFVDRKLYTGVEDTLPSLYPYAIMGNSGAYDLYHRAAITGRQQTGVIDDRLGERIACVTPVGSSTGDTVFLLETSVFTAELANAAKPYLRNYLLLAGGLLVTAAALLLAAILRIMAPLREISSGLERFSKGDRSVRIKNHTNDELADISRVFNKLAGDLEAQSYTLRNLTDTYYRFIPRRMFELLGKENLSELTLGSAIQGRYSVLSASLTLDEEYLNASEQEELINCFFAMLNKECSARGVMLLPDGIGLRHLLLVCEAPSVAAELAFATLAQADSHNARSPVQSRLDVSFLLHTGELSFGVFGDKERYVPSLLSPDMERTLSGGSRFRRLSGRVLVTDAAFGLLPAEQYRHRFIGYADETEHSPGLYDLYDSCPASAIRLFSETAVPFARAVELYYQRRYYDAKSLFTVVLRDNQYDNVARHYIFQCEKKLGKTTS
jgi:HAMP domain-containing protein